MGRKALGRERINITLPPELVAQTDTAAKVTKASRSDVIETALKRHLGRNAKRKAGK